MSEEHILDDKADLIARVRGIAKGLGAGDPEEAVVTGQRRLEALAEDLAKGLHDG